MEGCGSGKPHHHTCAVNAQSALTPESVESASTDAGETSALKPQNSAVNQSTTMTQCSSATGGGVGDGPRSSAVRDMSTREASDSSDNSSDKSRHDSTAANVTDVARMIEQEFEAGESDLEVLEGVDPDDFREFEDTPIVVAPREESSDDDGLQEEEVEPQVVSDESEYEEVWEEIDDEEDEATAPPQATSLPLELHDQEAQNRRGAELHTLLQEVLESLRQAKKPKVSAGAPAQLSSQNLNENFKEAVKLTARGSETSKESSARRTEEDADIECVLETPGRGGKAFSRGPAAGAASPPVASVQPRRVECSPADAPTAAAAVVPAQRPTQVQCPRASLPSVSSRTVPTRPPIQSGTKGSSSKTRVVKFSGTVVERSGFGSGAQCAQKTSATAPSPNSARPATQHLRCVCADCDKVFSNTTELDEHLKSDHGLDSDESPSRVDGAMQFLIFRCRFCDKVFRSKNGLGCHLPVHTGRYPHNCGLCGKGFIRRESVERHVNQLHRGMVEMCVSCQKMFYCRRDWEKHTEVCTGGGGALQQKKQQQHAISRREQKRVEQLTCWKCMKEFRLSCDLDDHAIQCWTQTSGRPK